MSLFRRPSIFSQYYPPNIILLILRHHPCRLYLDSLPPNLVSLEAQNAVIALSEGGGGSRRGSLVLGEGYGAPPGMSPLVAPLAPHGGDSRPSAPAATAAVVRPAAPRQHPLERRLSNIAMMKGESA